jgi:cyclic pyranopterin phosphate synthase
MFEFTHFDAQGRSRMVDISGKGETQRIAVARGSVKMKQSTLKMIQEGRMSKGDVLGVARVAAIMGAKQTSALIPMCHPLLLTAVDIYFECLEDEGRIEIEAQVKNVGQTGVEMEALTAVAVAGLTIYDMCKAVDRGMVIDQIRLVKKSGGKSGDFIREGE